MQQRSAQFTQYVGPGGGWSKQTPLFASQTQSHSSGIFTYDESTGDITMLRSATLNISVAWAGTRPWGYAYVFVYRNLALEEGGESAYVCPAGQCACGSAAQDTATDVLCCPQQDPSQEASKTCPGSFWLSTTGRLSMSWGASSGDVFRILTVPAHVTDQTVLQATISASCILQSRSASFTSNVGSGGGWASTAVLFDSNTQTSGSGVFVYDTSDTSDPVIRMLRAADIDLEAVWEGTMPWGYAYITITRNRVKNCDPKAESCPSGGAQTMTCSSEACVASGGSGGCGACCWAENPTQLAKGGGDPSGGAGTCPGSYWLTTQGRLRVSWSAAAGDVFLVYNVPAHVSATTRQDLSIYATSVETPLRPGNESQVWYLGGG